MMKNYKILALSIIALFVSITSYGADFDLGEYGILSINIPNDWTVNSKPFKLSDDKIIGYNFAFRSANGTNAKLLLTLNFIGNKKPNKTEIKKELIKNCSQFLPQSVEKKINIKFFSLENGVGAYCLLTDVSLVGKKIKSGQYKVMGSGLIQLNNHIFGTVSIFIDDVKSKEFKNMIGIINSMEINSKENK